VREPLGPAGRVSDYNADVQGADREYRVVIEYLEAAFPAARVPNPRGETAAAAPLFSVIEGVVERQLEISRLVLEDFTHQAVTRMLRTNRVAETMREQPGKRIVLNRDRCGELVVEINPLEET
jgi:hypothetical protein